MEEEPLAVSILTLALTSMSHFLLEESLVPLLNSSFRSFDLSSCVLSLLPPRPLSDILQPFWPSCRPLDAETLVAPNAVVIHGLLKEHASEEALSFIQDVCTSGI